MIRINSISPENFELLINKSATIKTLACIDIFFAVLNIIVSNFLFIATIINLIFSYIGYNGAKVFNKCQTKTYIIFLIVQNIFRSILFGILIFNPELIGITSTIPGIAYLMNALILVINIYINYFVIGFYKLMDNFSQSDLTQIIESPPVIVIPSSEV